MTGAAFVLCFGVLIGLVGMQTLSYQAREAMAEAQHRIPELASSYRSQHQTMAGFDPYLMQQLAPLPVLTRTGSEPGRPPYRGGPHRPPNENLIVRLLMVQNRPVTVQYGGMHTTVFVRPSLYERFVEIYSVIMLLVAAAVIVVSWRIAIVVAENSLEPLVRTTAALNRFGDGDFTPATVSTSDTTEVGDLAPAYNRAVGQITRALDERAQASAEMRQFVADAGHQLRTPLTVIIGYLSSMAGRGVRESDGPHVSTMLAQGRRMKTLIDELLLLARLEQIAPLGEMAVDANEVVSDLPSSFPPEIARRVCVELSREPLTVRAAAAEFRDALVAITDNALKYGGDATVDVRVSRVNGSCEIAVRDRGPGFSAEDLSFAFDRFYRGSASEGTRGTGLGLAIAAKAVTRAQGAIHLSNLRQGGGECIIRLPLLAGTRN
jgi:two-component system OmpR family sensor kinase